MNSSFKMRNPGDLSAFSRNANWFLAWGLALVILGVIAIGAAEFTTVVSVVFLGALIFISGVVITIDTFTFWWRKWGGFFLHLLMGVLCLAAGGMLMKSPILATVSLTLFLGVFYILLGVFRVIYALSLQFPRWGWSLFNGIISLLLGILIMASWPASSLYIIGLFVGIDLLFCGWTYIIASLAARALTK